LILDIKKRRFLRRDNPQNRGVSLDIAVENSLKRGKTQKTPEKSRKNFFVFSSIFIRF